jgi:hypothetical protein
MIKEGRGKAEVAGTSPNDAIDPERTSDLNGIM